jgi:hypothetical protein
MVSWSDSCLGSGVLTIMLRRFKEAASMSLFFLSLTLSRRFCGDLDEEAGDFLPACWLE